MSIFGIFLYEIGSKGSFSKIDYKEFFFIGMDIPQKVILYTPAYMGQFPQDGENGQIVAFFYFFWSSAVTKRFDFFDFSQLSGYILKMFSF